MTNYQEKYLETDKMLREREADYLSAKDNADIIVKLQAQIARLEGELMDASRPKEDDTARVTAHEAVGEQQR